MERALLRTLLAGEEPILNFFTAPAQEGIPLQFSNLHHTPPSGVGALKKI
jgi:hypothetical protein